MAIDLLTKDRQNLRATLTCINPMVGKGACGLSSATQQLECGGEIREGEEREGKVLRVLIRVREGQLDLCMEWVNPSAFNTS